MALLVLQKFHSKFGINFLLLFCLQATDVGWACPLQPISFPFPRFLSRSKRRHRSCRGWRSSWRRGWCRNWRRPLSLRGWRRGWRHGWRRGWHRYWCLSVHFSGRFFNQTKFSLFFNVLCLVVASSAVDGKLSSGIPSVIAGGVPLGVPLRPVMKPIETWS